MTRTDPPCTRPKILAIPLMIALLALTAPRVVRAQGMGMAPLPLSAVPVLSVVGGLATSTLIGIDLADGQRTHPAVRNIGLGCAGLNLLMGLTGVILTATLDAGDWAPLSYSISGTVLALGAVGGGLALAADTYDPHPRRDPTVKEPASALRAPPGAFVASWRWSFH
jgi:hypothetical protein